MGTEAPMTTNFDQPTAPAAASERVPEWLETAIRRIEGDDRLDPLARRVRNVADRIAGGAGGPVLAGDWLGHALHPLLTDFPLGCWLSAGVLDLVGGKRSRPAAQRLVALGLVMVPPTVATGLVDYTGADSPPTRRVGAVHAAGNSMVALCYFGSWRARRRGRHFRGVVWGLAGGGLAVVTGYLGGHLSFGRGVGIGARGDLDTAAEPSLRSNPPLDAYTGAPV
jgi:uncharacterized membrane protein